jgi:hypothetical protein
LSFYLQVQCSLLYRCPLENGLKATADALGVRTVKFRSFEKKKLRLCWLPAFGFRSFQ